MINENNHSLWVGVLFHKNRWQKIKGPPFNPSNKKNLQLAYLAKDDSNYKYNKNKCLYVKALNKTTVLKASRCSADRNKRRFYGLCEIKQNC